MKNAYIYSRINSTAQIGTTLFQPCTGAMFTTTRPSKKKALAVVKVKDASMRSAIEALSKVN